MDIYLSSAPLFVSIADAAVSSFTPVYAAADTAADSAPALALTAVSTDVSAVVSAPTVALVSAP